MDGGGSAFRRCFAGKLQPPVPVSPKKYAAVLVAAAHGLKGLGTPSKWSARQRLNWAATGAGTLLPNIARSAAMAEVVVAALLSASISSPIRAALKPTITGGPQAGR